MIKVINFFINSASNENVLKMLCCGYEENGVVDEICGLLWTLCLKKVWRGKKYAVT